MMADDQLEGLIEQAHKIFGETSIYEVIDLEDRESATLVIVDHYGSTRQDDMEKYFCILDQIRDGSLTGFYVPLFPESSNTIHSLSNVQTFV
jgi:hypothetical protein